MKCKITLTAQRGVDSKAEIEHEILVIQDIIGEKLVSGGDDKGGNGCAVYEGEFHEFYQKVKDRIMHKIEAYE